jgi:hypothetical protein
MPIIISYEFYSVIASDGNSFTIWYQEYQSGSAYGAPVSYAIITSEGDPWSPSSNITYDGHCAFSRNGEVYVVTCSVGSGIVITDTGINIPETGDRFYGFSELLSSDGHTYYLITTSDGIVYRQIDSLTGTWTNLTSDFITPPAPTGGITISAADIAWANAEFGSLGFEFGVASPEPITGGGINEHTGPPFAMKTQGGIIEHAQANFPVKTQAGIIELTAPGTGTGPNGTSPVAQGGLYEKVGLPVRQEG